MTREELAKILECLAEASRELDPAVSCCLYAIGAAVWGCQTVEFCRAIEPVIRKLREQNLQRMRGGIIQ